MVIEQEPFSTQRSCRAEYARLSEALREFPSALDILLYSRDEFAYRKGAPNHVVGRAQPEGRVIRVRQQAGQCNAGEGAAGLQDTPWMLDAEFFAGSRRNLWPPCAASR